MNTGKHTPRPCYVLPTKPLSIIDAINRMSLATGGFRSACAGSDADYNGHSVEGRFNDHRGYWVAQYHWCDRIVVARGDLAHCLESAKTFYAAQGRGASVKVECRDADDAAFCEAAGYIPADAEDRTWRDWRFDEVGSAVAAEQRGWGSHPSHLIAATSMEDYRVRCRNGFASAPIAALAKATGSAA